MLTKERANELPDVTLKSIFHSANDEECGIIAAELKKRGYVIKGFSWGRPSDSNPVNEARIRILGW